MKSFQFIILLLIFNPVRISCQENISPVFNPNEILVKNRITEIELAFLGAGIQVIWDREIISHGFGLNIRYINYVISSNNKDFNDYISRHDEFVKKLSGDIFKVKYFVRLSPSSYFNVDLSPIISYTSGNHCGDECMFGMYGFESVLGFLIYKQTRFSTAISIRKSLESNSYFVVLTPIIISIKI